MVSVKQVIYLNGRFLTQPLTGVQRTAYELVKALDQLIDIGYIDKNVYTFNLIYSGIPITTIELKHINIIQRGVLKGNLWEQIELPFYTNGHLLISMCTVSALFKLRQIVIIHDASPLVNPTYFSFAFRTWYSIAFRILGKVARKIITVSNFSKGELMKYAGVNSEKITVIYNAADHILRFNEASEKFKQKVNLLKPYCLAVSSLGKNKNFSSLAAAINKIDFKGYNMLIAGGKMATLNHAAIDNTATYLGYVTNEELRYLYANASLFVFPSFYEGFGIPPLEAMISGCPVLSSNTSSLPEILNGACAYCDPYDIDDMAGKITGLLNSPDTLRSLVDKGHDQACKYNWEKSARHLFELIKETIAS